MPCGLILKVFITTVAKVSEESQEFVGNSMSHSLFALSFVDGLIKHTPGEQFFSLL